MSDHNEEWRTVPEHADYEVSSLGRVRSHKGRKDDGIPFTPRLLSIKPDRAGYPRTQLDKIHYNVHRLVAAAWLGPCPEGKEVDHINNIRNDNRPENIRYATRQENMAKIVRKLATECPKGHPLSGDNLRIRRGGHRDCRTCAREYQRNRPPSGLACTAESCDRMAENRLRTDSPVCEKHYQADRRAAKRAEMAKAA